MPSREGSFIWYELMTADPDAAKRFYDTVIGWQVGPRPDGEMDYRMIDAGDGLVGGVLRLDGNMLAGGARPAWFGYISVADVDEKAEAIRQDGGGVMVPPTDIPDVSRFALVTDPSGAPVYIMRGDSPEDSHSFARDGRVGHVSWNELATTDQDAAFAFYGRHFGLKKTGAMPMGELGEYSFFGHDGQPVGAMMTRSEDGLPPGWTYYFRVADIDPAVAAIQDGGGTVLHGPHVVPTGERVLVATDPEGAVFGLVAGEADAA